MKILAIANQKGGTGKTTTAAALAQAAALNGLKTLAIDLDPQQNLSFALNVKTGGKGSYELLNGADPESLIQHLSDNLDTIPGNWNLQTITTGQGSARRLEKAIAPITGRYDAIVIDTPPTAGELQYNALQAATGLIIPMRTAIYDLQAFLQIAETAKQFQNSSNKKLRLTGIVLTQYQPRSIIARQMEQSIEKAAQRYETQIIGRIRNGIAVQEAAAMRQSLYEYAPRAKPTADYMALYKAIFR